MFRCIALHLGLGREGEGTFCLGQGCVYYDVEVGMALVRRWRQEERAKRQSAGVVKTITYCCVYVSVSVLSAMKDAPLEPDEWRGECWTGAPLETGLV